MATNQKPTPYNDFMNKQKLFRLNRLLSSKKVIIIIMIATKHLKDVAIFHWS